MNGITAFQTMMSGVRETSTRHGFKEGQLLIGKILQLFPDQKALLQIGQLQLVAKLEAPLKTLQNYVLAIDHKSGDDMILLKMVEEIPEPNATAKGMAGEILTAARLQKSPGALKLAESLVRNNIPIQEKQLVSALHWLQGVSPAQKDKAYQSIQFSLQQGYPASEGVFRSILEAMDDKPMILRLQELGRALTKEDLPGEAASNLSKVIESILKKPDEIAQAKLYSVIDAAAKGTDSEEKEIANVILQKMQAAQNKFDAAGTILQQGQPKEHQELSTVFPVVFKQEGKPVIRERAGLTEIETAWLLKLAENSSGGLEEGSHVKQLLAFIADKLGMKDEFHVFLSLKSDQQGDLEKEFHTLKPLLIAASKETEIPEIKEKAEQLIHRLNGVTFLQQEHGPLQTQWMQIPIHSEWMKSDLSIQWKLRKKANGQIDPDFCRILLYLDLTSLKEMMVDVQIQDRVASITVHNNSQHLKQLASKFSGELKNQLQEIGLNLSIFKVKSFEDKLYSGDGTGHKFGVPAERAYQGVDLKI
ncbi:hypothetical protein [Metabacillus sp. RGM 3146]|uniref:hypothetical protein n=1 Tax=Metabacillus sp. RGM 3146 TaxID=3401092 RepID=UPI003B993320